MCEIHCASARDFGSRRGLRGPGNVLRSRNSTHYHIFNNLELTQDFTLGALPLVEGGGAKHSPPGQYQEIAEKMKMWKLKKIKVHRNDREVFRKYLGHI